MAINIENVNSLPETPGVYFFKNGKDIIYIGKATSLHSRVRSYFSNDIREKRSALIERMVHEADNISYQETGSVLEALILESNLIKEYQPIYNTKDKDGKSFNYVVITKEEYPRIFTVREQELQTIYDPDEFKYIFGPYTSGSALVIALRIIRKIFPFRGKKEKIKKTQRISSLNTEIGLSPDLEKVSVQEYARTIRHIALFFQGKKSILTKALTKEMKEYAKNQSFEKAQEVKRKLFALEHINDVALIQADTKENTIRIEAYDVAHISGAHMVGVMVVLENGFLKKGDYRKFNITSTAHANDTKALREILTRRLHHNEWQLPQLIVVDGGKAQINVARSVLEEFGYTIPVVSVVKNEHHQPREVLGDTQHKKQYEKEILIVNNESHRFAISFHSQKRRKII